jgi:rod shape-determining protein MreB and related proteins
LSMRGIVDSRSLNVGGQSIDQAIVETLKKDYSFLIGQLSAEQLKRRCDAEDGTGTMEVKGRNLSTGLPDSLKVPCSLVESQWSNYCNTIVDLIVQTLASCPPELVGDIMDRGIVLVGGGAQCKGLVNQLMERTEVPMIVADEPENCVIRGLLKYSQDTRGAVLTNFFSNLPRPQVPISSKRQ